MGRVWRYPGYDLRLYCYDFSRIYASVDLAQGDGNRGLGRVGPGAVGGSQYFLVCPAGRQS